LGNTVLVVVPALWILYGLGLTRSRGGALGLVVLVALAVRDRLGRLGSWIVSGMVLAGMLAANFGGARALSLRAASISGRVEAWSAGLQMLKQSPLFGVGYRAFTDYHEMTAHNSFVLCFAETGMLGYFFWLGLLVATARDLAVLAGLSAADPAQAAVRHWARTVRLAYYTFLTTAWFLSRTYIPTLYLLIAMGVGLREIAQRNGWVKLPGLDQKWLAMTVIFQVLTVTAVYAVARLRWMQ
ncbi:MAG: O-antigen ligase family protein, partial [Bryobacteraceae bacterium]